MGRTPTDAELAAVLAFVATSPDLGVREIRQGLRYPADATGDARVQLLLDALRKRGSVGRIKKMVRRGYGDPPRMHWMRVWTYFAKEHAR